MEGIIEARPTQEPKRLTVGEEFIAWAVLLIRESKR